MRINNTMNSNIFHNIHPLLGIACEKEENKGHCKQINHAINLIRSFHKPHVVEASAFVGVASVYLRSNEKWDTDEALNVMFNILKAGLE